MTICAAVAGCVEGFAVVASGVWFPSDARIFQHRGPDLRVASVPINPVRSTQWSRLQRRLCFPVRLGSGATCIPRWQPRHLTCIRSRIVSGFGVRLPILFATQQSFVPDCGLAGFAPSLLFMESSDIKGPSTHPCL